MAFVPRFAELDLLADPNDFAFKEDLQTMGQPSRRLLREVLEWQALDTPQGFEAFGRADVYLRMDTGSSRVLKALMVGPPGTPYELGLFEFDIFLPADYPLAPPVLRHKTTVGGTISFAPNLYADGKVCLSLLNNTGGPAWTPACQLKQVLLSIQSCAFTERPYFNIPATEVHLGTVQGEKDCALHSAQVRVATLKHAMSGQLKSPPAAFKDVVAWHFARNVDRVKHLAAEWASQRGDTTRSFQNLPPHHPKALREVVTELEGLLDANRLKVDQGALTGLMSGLRL